MKQGTTGLSNAHDESNSISRDDIHDVLSNQRRILVLRYMDEATEEVVYLRDVVDFVAACERSTTVDNIDYQSRKSVYTALRQTHLPKLDRHAVVEFDKDRGELRLGDGAKRVLQHLAYAPGTNVPWHRYYSGLTGLGVIVIAAAYAGAVPFGMGWSYVAGILLGLFGVMNVAHVHSVRRAHPAYVDDWPVDR